MTATILINKAKQYIGVKGRPNTFTKWYAGRHGKQFETAAWCDMFVSYVANSVGLGKFVGEFAYCPYHIKWFKDNGRWGNVPKVGAIVFYDWDQDKLSDHVGIVESIKGKTVIAIEGNKANVVQRVARSTGIIGYGYPDYPTPKSYTVKVGDTLSGIAAKQLGSSALWKKLYDANKNVIGPSANKIKPGMVLKIPK